MLEYYNQSSLVLALPGPTLLDPTLRDQFE